MWLLRLPVTWLVLLEIAVVGGLGVATWHVIDSRAHISPVVRRDLGVLPGVTAGQTESALATPTPRSAVFTAPTPRPPGPTPGLGTSSAFLGAELKTINRDQSTWEGSEWAIIEAVLGFARAYVENVVLPGVRSAESGRR